MTGTPPRSARTASRWNMKPNIPHGREKPQRDQTDLEYAIYAAFDYGTWTRNGEPVNITALVKRITENVEVVRPG